MGPSSTFRPARRSMLANDTGTAAVRRASKIAAIHPRRPRAASILSPSFIAAEVPGVTLLESRSVRPVIEKDHNVPKEELLEFEGHRNIAGCQIPCSAR